MVRKFILMFAFLFCCPPVFAAFTLDTSAQSAEANTNGLTFAFTCGANAKLLVLGIMYESASRRAGGPPTYNGVPMLPVGLQIVAAGELSAELWYLSNPVTGVAADIVIPDTATNLKRGMAASFNSGAPGAGVEVFSTTNADAANPSITLTPMFDGDVIVDVLGDGSNTAPTGRSQTQLFSNDEGNQSSNLQYALQANKAAITFSWTVALENVAHIVAAFRESYGTVVTGNSKITGESTVNGY
jgi:peptidoglycan hydrolase-like protein with peptidoglycan-binding domain